jgi:polyhydroxybutyrate depolymerase
MNYRYLVFTLASLFFAGAVFSQQTLTQSFSHNGVNRSYIIYIPASYNANSPVPLLLNFHGYTSSAAVQLAYSNFRPIADTAGFITVHPQGTNDFVNNAHFNVGWGTSTIDDVSFTNALLDTIIANYTIETKEIYSTGFSNGGFMSYLLACQLGNRFAAVASVGGSMSPSTFSNCTPAKAMPMLEVHGTNDGTVAYNGSAIATHIDTVINYWVQQNQTNNTPIVTNLPNINTADGSTVTKFEYNNGLNGTEVQLYKVNNGNHTWPGASAGNPNLDIDASEVIWNFFRRFDNNGIKITVGTAENSAVQNFKLLNNITSDRVNLFSEKESRFELFNSLGQDIKSGRIRIGNNSIDISEFKNDMYFLRIELETFKVVLAK